MRFMKQKLPLGRKYRLPWFYVIVALWAVLIFF